MKCANMNNFRVLFLQKNLAGNYSFIYLLKQTEVSLFNFWQAMGENPRMGVMLPSIVFVSSNLLEVCARYS